MHSAGFAADARMPSGWPTKLPLLCLPSKCAATAAVQSCEPAVAGMAQLLAQLNAGGSFSCFVRCMRREFQAEVQQQAQQVPQPEPLAAC